MTKSTLAAIFGVTVALEGAAGCGPDRIPDDSTSEPDADDPIQEDEEGVVGDRWNCGELGLSCVGPLNIGECIDDQCQGRLWECRGWSSTCDEYCQLEGRTCDELGCEGATAYGWPGSQEEADALCGFNDSETVIPLFVGCDEPLAGMATTVRCCCTTS